MMLEPFWADIGWALEHASERSDLVTALDPLRSHNRAGLIEPLLRLATEDASASDIRRTHKEKWQVIEKRILLKPRCQEHRQICTQAVLALDEMLQNNKNLPLTIANEAFLDQFFNTFWQWIAAKAELESAIRAIDGLELKELNQTAHFAQTEMLRFVREDRARFTPRRFASAFAGLPDMGYRQSLDRCGSEPFPTPPDWHYRLLAFVARVWDRRQNSKPDHVIELFEVRIRKLVRKDSYLYEKLSSNMGDLRRAVAEAIKASRHPREVPYLITTCFERNISRPKTHVELFMDAASKT